MSPGKTIFTKDEQNATLAIERVFPAAADRVWQALTDPAILDQWWAPAPWKTDTVYMDFRVGGYWHYAMNGPEGEQHFGRMDYLEIDPGRLSYQDSSPTHCINRLWRVGVPNACFSVVLQSRTTRLGPHYLFGELNESPVTADILIICPVGAT